MNSVQRTVLVVEDDHLILLNARMLLENAGYRVLVAESGADALLLLADEPDIAAVFTDIAMPGPIDGLTLADRLHASRPELPVYITSGSVEVAEEKLPPSATFLAKPYTAAKVLRLLAA